jgi:hypothetical protein
MSLRISHCLQISTARTAVVNKFRLTARPAAEKITVKMTED